MMCFLFSKDKEIKIFEHFYHSLKLQDDQWVLTGMKVVKHGDPNIFVTGLYVLSVHYLIVLPPSPPLEKVTAYYSSAYSLSVSIVLKLLI